MKQISKMAAMFVLAAASSSCSFLEVEKIGKSDIQTYFSEVSALEPAMNGIYNLMFSFYDRYHVQYSEICGDALVLSASTAGTWVDYQNFVTTSNYETSAVGYIWKSGYEIINNANQVIYWAPFLKESFPYDVQQIDNVIASALFVRALAHFELCRVYGQNYTYTPDASHLGIAIRDRIPSLSETIKRSSVKECYQRSLDDLTLALDTYDNCQYNAFRPTPLACKALLARIYLYMGNMEMAEKYASDVIAVKNLTPRDKYLEMFCDPSEMGDEAIFRLNGFDQTSSLNSLFYYQSPVARPSASLKAKFGDDDIRKSLFTHINAGQTFENVMLKYTCTADVASEEERYYNLSVFRLSEMYLIRAEARCSQGNLKGAESDLKAIISRATGKDVSAISLSWSDAGELDALIYEERQKELCFEGHRFFDIARRHETLTRDEGTTSVVRTLAYPDNRFVLQIPYVEIDANHDMQQNPL